MCLPTTTAYGTRTRARLPENTTKRASSITHSDPPPPKKKSRNTRGPPKTARNKQLNNDDEDSDYLDRSDSCYSRSLSPTNRSNSNSNNNSRHPSCDFSETTSTMVSTPGSLRSSRASVTPGSTRHFASTTAAAAAATSATAAAAIRSSPLRPGGGAGSGSGGGDSRSNLAGWAVGARGGGGPGAGAGGGGIGGESAAGQVAPPPMGRIRLPPYATGAGATAAAAAAASVARVASGGVGGGGPGGGSTGIGGVVAGAAVNVGCVSGLTRKSSRSRIPPVVPGWEPEEQAERDRELREAGLAQAAVARASWVFEVRGWVGRGGGGGG